jgi:hypothetical protein
MLNVSDRQLTIQQQLGQSGTRHQRTSTHQSYASGSFNAKTADEEARVWFIESLTTPLSVIRSARIGVEYAGVGSKALSFHPIGLNPFLYRLDHPLRRRNRGGCCKTSKPLSHSQRAE